MTPVDPNAVSPEENFGPRYLLATALVVLMFMAVITYGQWVAASVAEEKASRVMELLITAATPRQLLLGKVMGAGGAGLMQYGVVLAAAMAGLLLQGTLSRLVLGDSGGSTVELQGLSIEVLLVVGLFFVGGFGLYATLYAALGSTASRQEEVQNITGPMIIVGVAGYLISFAALNAPDADWVQALSFVPFFSPYLIPDSDGARPHRAVGDRFGVHPAHRGRGHRPVGCGPHLLGRRPAVRPEGRAALRLARGPRQPLAGQAAFTPATRAWTVAFASPNSIAVCGSPYSGLSIPAKPEAMLRLSTMTLCALSTFRMGMP